MFYEIRTTYALGQTSSSKTLTTLRITAGVVVQVEILFPVGCAYKTHVHINDSLHQLWPSNPDGDFSGEGLIKFPEFYRIDQPPYQLWIYGWNESADNDHKVAFRVGILPFEAFEVPRGTIGQWLSKAFGMG